MALITLNDLSIGFRGPPLLDGVSCQIESGQRIGLLGRNGAGKTTFMRILSGQIEPDGGQLKFAPHTRVALLPQDVPRDIHGNVADVIADGWQFAGESDLHDDPWKKQHGVEQIMSRMQLTDDVAFENLSTGMKRRVLLAQALVSAPDLLLLDEPTNHLDIDSINWLEEFLSRWDATMIFVTHDRRFLRKIADRILEIDRGRLFDWSCDYDTFLKRKEAALEAEQSQHALFDKKLAQEEVWIRQGIKARRTRNEGRVRALKRMRRERSERRTEPGKVKLQIDHGMRSGNLIVDAEDISFAYDNRPIFQNFSTTIMRGDKVGLMGPNGAGKTTLLRVLLGKLPTSTGHIRLGTNVRIAYFDQLREQLTDNKSVQDNVSDGSDTIKLGDNSKHVIGYLQDFLFSPERARTEVRFLSGGERNRVLLAKLFAKPANVIVLDEPTNDLDTETLELLEERLVEFQGSLLLVSHDREFLNNVVTSTIVFEPRGVKEYVGGYDDWLRQRPEATKPPSPRRATKVQEVSTGDKTSTDQRRRLSYKEQQELAALPETIERLETDIADLHQLMAQPEFYKGDGQQVALKTARLQELEDQLTSAYARWEELEP